jgi:carotenoid 1,2-hydratase
VFSPRYAAAARRGAPPLDHCAVNCALYRNGRRLAWAFTEHRGASLERRALAIGASRLRYAEDGTLRIAIAERTAPWGRPVALDLVLEPMAPAAPEMRVDGARPHFWQARMPRARAWLGMRSERVEGLGYHDTNHGTERLGGSVRGWRWTRIHAPEATWVHYRPAGAAPVLELEAGARATALRVRAPAADRLRRSGWGLPVPSVLAAGPAALPVAAALESSPFYARLEGGGEGTHALGEVADFRRFDSPLIRWMAHFRMRVERAA